MHFLMIPSLGMSLFLSNGFVALPGGEHLIPMCILCDSGLSLLFEGVLPMSEESKTDTSVLVFMALRWAQLWFLANKLS